MITQTQVLNTSIKDQIKFLETDKARSKDNQVKVTQVAQLKTSFTKQLQEYRLEEANYEKRYREQIARQYRIVNPEATDAEVQEASQADWGNEGVFQTAVSIERVWMFATSEMQRAAYFLLVDCCHVSQRMAKLPLVESCRVVEERTQRSIPSPPHALQSSTHMDNN